MEISVKPKKKLHWVSAHPESAPVEIVIKEYDHLIIKAKPEENDTMEQIVNRNSLKEIPAMAENGIMKLNVDDMLQLERKGYYRIDKKINESLILIKIPDGKKTTPAPTSMRK